MEQQLERPDGAHLCPACRGASMHQFYELSSVPTNSCILLDSAEAARAYPKGDIKLAYCQNCGFISNVAFDPDLPEYSGRYEETQGFSPTFRSYHEQLARDLIEQHDLRNKKVVEIGCGKGEFLHLVCALGDNEGLGFDPSYVEDREQRVSGKRVEFVKDYFSGKYSVDHADFVCCKMTLEHIPQVRTFVDTIRRSVSASPDSVIYFQVPESTRIVRECAFEDIYYEHCSYFTPASLAFLFSNLDFDVIRTGIQYDGQYLTVEATWNGDASRPVPEGEDLEMLTSYVRSFPDRVQEKTDKWRSDIISRAEGGRTVVLWGSGSKGVSFLTTLDLGDAIQYVVDINPHRQGFYMSGTGQRIISPEELAGLQPDYVVVMNRIYVPEIRNMLQNLGLNPEIAAL